MTETITKNVVSIFEGFRMAPTPVDEYALTGRQKLIEKMMPYISDGSPIDFVMLGYPMKSTNDRDKVIGVHADMAEQVSINNFTRFNKEIQKVYQPGVNITIVNDGFVFNDLLGASDSVVYNYKEDVLEMAHKAPMTFYDLSDFYPKKHSTQMARNSLVKQFGIDDVELSRRVLMNPDVNLVYRGMMKFMEEELANRNYTSRNQLHIAAKKLAREMMMRNEAYGGLVRNEFPNHIRLSMHPSTNNGNKYSFQMIPSPRAWTSPWHAALLIGADGMYATVHKKDALAAGYELQYKDGRPYNFIES